MNRPKRNIRKPKQFPTVGISSQEESDLRQAIKSSLLSKDDKNKCSYGADGCLPGPSTRSPIYSHLPNSTTSLSVPSMSASIYSHLPYSPVPISVPSESTPMYSKLPYSPSPISVPSVSAAIPLTEVQLERITSNRLKALSIREAKSKDRKCHIQGTGSQQSIFNGRKKVIKNSRKINKQTSLIEQIPETSTNTVSLSSVRSISDTTAVILPLPSTQDLPPFPCLSTHSISWGDVDSGEFFKQVNQAYEEVVFWKRNLFTIPYGQVGSEFVRETARLFYSFNSGNPLERIVMKAIAIMSHLLLQKPHFRTKQKENVEHLQRRLKLWRRGEILTLLCEGRLLQSRLHSRHQKDRKEKDKVRSFTDNMQNGNVKGAINILMTQEKASVLPLTTEVLAQLKNKHPPAEQIHIPSILPGVIQPINSILFAGLTGECIRTSALFTQGGAGPSGSDADQWRLMCVSFGDASNYLCDSMASMARRLSTEMVDPSSIEAFITNRRIPLDKNPGLRPIGVGEAHQRIISKSIVRYLKQDILSSAGGLQLCAGQEGGCEAIIHAMHQITDSQECEGILLIDADNAFNRLNRAVALRNIQIICPSVSTFAINCYRDSSRLFITGGGEISSQEGTTQGDPLSMPFYALSITPLIQKVSGNVQQAWYADDAQAAG